MFSFNDGLDVYIASRDRPKETIRAIRALQKVDFGVTTRIFVSDNASSEDKILHNLPANVIHLIRESCDAQSHFNQIVNELNSEWALITHDDDEILPSLGEFFRKAITDSDVNIVSGRSRIIGANGVEIFDEQYEKRLRRANLYRDSGTSIENFGELLFDYGTLLPASAIILKSALVKKGFKLNPDTDYAGDLEYAFSITRGAKVRYCGSEPIMNYHLHGSNSVFNSELPFVLPSQTLICRICELQVNNSLVNPQRLEFMRKDLKRAVVLSFEAGETQQFETLMQYVFDFESNLDARITSWFVLLLFKTRYISFPLRYVLRFRRRFFVRYRNFGI